MSKIVSSREELAKHVRATMVDDNWVDGKAFLPRPTDNDGSSVHRMGVFSDDDEVAISAVRKISRLSLKANQRFAQISVGDLFAAVEQHCQLAVVKDPLPAEGNFSADNSHALIKGFPPASLLDNLLGDLIRRKISNVHLAIE